MHTHDAIGSGSGSGQAGPFLAVRLAQSGLKVSLVGREHQRVFSAPPGSIWCGDAPASRAPMLFPC
jgi:2-polyprenyl-6-methoxyphenol hydroxylase-like FAD-dependent oxidoreductase